MYSILDLMRAPRVWRRAMVLQVQAGTKLLVRELRSVVRLVEKMHLCTTRHCRNFPRNATKQAPIAGMRYFYRCLRGERLPNCVLTRHSNILMKGDKLCT
jgi:hypothetical protein